MKKVKTALLGYGHLGRWHAQKASQIENCDFVAIVEPIAVSHEKIKEQFPGITVVTKLDEVLNLIDAAIVVTPTSFHFECVETLLKNNKHVFCEKPLCSNYEQALKLAPLIKNNVLQVGHSERCHMIWDKLLKELPQDSGKKTIKINRFAPFKGRATDVDVVQDLMIHDIDLIHFLFSIDIRSVQAIGHKTRTNHWDHVTAFFESTKGDQIIITSGRNHVQEERSLEVMTDAGCYYVDLFKNEYSFATNTEFEPDVFVRTESYEKRDHLLIEQEKFYDSVLNNSKVFVDYEDGKKAVLLVDKVLESLETNKKINL